MNDIYYIGYYALPEKCKNRECSPAAVNKMDYICSVINKVGYNVNIISASGSSEADSGKTLLVNNKTKLKLFTSYGKRGRIRKVLSRWFLMLQFIMYLFIHIDKNDTVLVYHSLGYAKLITILKKIKKFRMVLEVEEKYSDVTGRLKHSKIEDKFFDIADEYLFSTELLSQSVNAKHKPEIIIYGTYKVEPERANYRVKNNLEHTTVHLVYAGTLDPRKGGAAAAAAAEFLPSNYHIHIIGFGSDEEIRRINMQIETISQKSACTVTYDGLLLGEEYIRFIQNCHAGLSTQLEDVAFNNTSFPSKVLSYLANGLRVISVKIPVLEQSSIGGLLYYYNGNDPKSIANAIMKVDWNTDYDSRKTIAALDIKFTEEIRDFLTKYRI